MKAWFAPLLLGVLSCAAAPSAPEAPEPAMQAIVDRIAGAHPEVARLSIHAAEDGGPHMRIVASTVAGRVGESSDPEDLLVSRTGEPVEMKEGHNLDYTAPVVDASGRTVAVIGVTVSGASGGSDGARLALAKQIAAEAGAAVLDAR
jgi:hypothetical protein